MKIRQRYNFEFEAIYGKPDIISETKRNQLRWFRHILRMKESRVTKALFRNKQDFGTRSAGIQRLTWEESVETDLNQLNKENWTLLARDRKKWGNALDQNLSTKWMYSTKKKKKKKVYSIHFIGATLQDRLDFLHCKVVSLARNFQHI